jgi:hypothetical protein
MTSDPFSHSAEFCGFEEGQEILRKMILSGKLSTFYQILYIVLGMIG